VEVELIIRERLKEEMSRFREDPLDISRIDAIQRTMELSRLLPVDVNLWETQNIYYAMAQSVCREMLEKPGGQDPDVAKWAIEFRRLGETLNFDSAAIPGC